MRIAARTELRWRTVLAFAEFPLRLLLVKRNVAVVAGEHSYENFSLFGAHFYCYGADATLVCEHGARRDSKRLWRTRCYCGSRTANGERVDCSAMTAAHRQLPFGTRVRVCHSSCVTVRINDRGP